MTWNMDDDDDVVDLLNLCVQFLSSCITVPLLTTRRPSYIHISYKPVHWEHILHAFNTLYAILQ